MVPAIMTHRLRDSSVLQPAIAFQGFCIEVNGISA